MKQKDSTYYLNLISKHFAGEANGEELIELADWLKEDSLHQTVFEDYQKTWKSLEKAKINKQLDVEKDLNEVKSKIGQTTDQSQETEKAGKIIEMDGGDEGGVRPLAQLMKVAAVMLIMVIPVYFIYQYFAAADTMLLRASNNMITKVLPDSTLVHLNAGSTLEYPEFFGGKQRQVTLKGEAWFEVTHNTHKPFVIQSNDVQVQVLGTSFYVNTKATDEKMEVVLKTGKVAVYYKSSADKPVVLNPNEKAVVNLLERKIQKSENIDPNYLSWKTRKLVFEGNTLAEVVPVLNKVYRSNIQIINPELNNCPLTATFDKQSLESVMAVIEATLDLEIERSGNLIKIIGGACEE